MKKSQGQAFIILTMTYIKNNKRSIKINKRGINSAGIGRKNIK